VDPRPRGGLDRRGRTVDVTAGAPCERRDHRRTAAGADVLGDRLDGLVVALRGDREAGLDDVDVQPGQLVGDLELLLDTQRDAGRLLTIAQGRVEDLDGVRVHRGGLLTGTSGLQLTRNGAPRGGG
jgi:hypothetical protein